MKMGWDKWLRILILIGILLLQKWRLCGVFSWEIISASLKLNLSSRIEWEVIFVKRQSLMDNYYEETMHSRVFYQSRKPAYMVIICCKVFFKRWSLRWILWKAYVKTKNNKNSFYFSLLFQESASSLQRKIQCKILSLSHILPIFEAWLAYTNIGKGIVNISLNNSAYFKIIQHH